MRGSRWLTGLLGSVLAGAAAQGMPVPADPASAEADFWREAYALKAEQSVRLDRFVAIGEKCGVLSDEDSATIRRRSREMRDAFAQDVHERDRAWACGYLAGLRAGALRGVDFVDAIHGAGCRRFARPGGPVMRIMTWTDKPQFLPDGRPAPARMPPELRLMPA